MDSLALIIAVAALLGGVALGWFLGARGAAQARAELARRENDFKAAIADLVLAEERASQLPALREELAALRDERDVARLELTAARARENAFEERLAEFKAAREAMAGQFREVAATMLGEAQKAFLERAEARFSQSGEQNEAKMKALLQPVESTLRRYEEGLQRVEKDRNDSYGVLREAITEVKAQLGETRSETAKLVNALRAAPKTRGRWGEQQFRNLIEIAGLSGHVDFAAEVSIATEDGALRPDFIIRLPGDQQLIVDVKCVLDAYLQASEATSAEDRQTALLAHARAVRNHAEALSRKAYWAQFEKAPDFVIMYIPGDNFLSSALEVDMELWERAARNRVIIAGPSAFLPLARTVASMWRQQKLTEDAREVGKLGKEMYERLATAATHLKRVGGGLNSAVENYNKFVASFEGRVLVSARRFQALNVDTGNSALDSIDSVDVVAKAPAVELLPSAAATEDPQAEAAE
ncbi:DNA recombination protein RmuC [Sphingomonas psychrotolerans]|uniref:DNA recombination protein RmuC homolog n=1 Tax=Sphingomonas psychrotolerans TaxID=1327635 RepID=A0ABU3N1R0_9SPHN|nr:DNA recombination protein RmuC [Sphingomonas psychrotolerans]MDT8757794.1 DNA recombination protein RmuC [Sphingomonas psychrotolerans]